MADNRIPEPDGDDDETWPRCTKKTWLIDDDVVIAGISGRFPESDNIDELARNLLDNVDMVTRDERRWPIGLNNDPTSRSGKLKNLEYFDDSFFCTIPILSDVMEPGSRIILETTYEAIADAGVAPHRLRGTKTGVYVGINTVANAEPIPQDDFSDVLVKDAALWVYGTSKALLANRISFLFDFNGPSTVIDTACSASMVALANAVHDLRTGNCEMAVVATSNICLAPYSSYVYHSLGLLSHDGKCKVFDKSADGFVRSETVGALLLMRRSQAKRVYATVLHAKTNTDGFKNIGLFAPFWLRQRNLMVETFQEAGIRPEEVDYFESHGTGTNVGDPQEARAVSDAYCRNRKDKLLVGAVKSNLGHTEGASGLCSVAKAIIIFEHKIIPANLHYQEPKPEIQSLHRTIEPVVKNTPFEGRIIGVNSFGVGGVNAHALLRINDRELGDRNEAYRIAWPVPRLITVCGRTENAVRYVFDFIRNNPEKVHRDFLALLNDSMKTAMTKGSSNFPYRGYMIITDENGDDNPDPDRYQYQEIIEETGNTQGIWLMFTGMGSQWTGMGRQLMQIETFATAIDRMAKVLAPYQIDLRRLVLDDHDDSDQDRTVHSFVAITSMQIALFDVFRLLNLPVQGIIGHSLGEIACAYADGCLTAEQAILTSYWRGKTVEESAHTLPKGLMAAVGLTVQQTRDICPEGVYIACHNGNDSVTVSGLYEPMVRFIDHLKQKNVFVRKVAGGEFPYHSVQMKMVGMKLLDKLKTVIPEPKRRSQRWISTSIPFKDGGDDPGSTFASAEYFVNNLQRPVLFEEGMKRIPRRSVCIEFAPHSLFNSIFKRCYKDYHYLSLMKKQERDNLQYFISAIGQIYIHGFNPDTENLYPKIEWPVVRGTQSIGSLIKWNHDHEYQVLKYPEHHNFATASNYKLKICLDESDWRFLKDHAIDGRVVFPLTGYLWIVWRAMSTRVGQPWHKVPVEFNNVRIWRPVIVNDSAPVKFVVQILAKTGDFILNEGNSLVCTGKVETPESNDFLQIQNEISDDLIQEEDLEKIDEDLNQREIYKELRVRGYDYGTNFQGLIRSSRDGSDGVVQWTGHWISFVDSALHLSLLSLPVRSLFVPVQIDQFRCDPGKLLESIGKANTVSEPPVITTAAASVYPNQEHLKQEFCYFQNVVQENKILNNADVERVVKANNDTVPFEIMNFDLESELIETEKRALFPVRFDFYNQLLVTKGIEIKGLIPVNVPRRSLADHTEAERNDLVLERHQFIPFQETCSVPEIVRYIENCSNLTDRLLLKKQTEKIITNNSFNGSNYRYSKILQELIETITDQDDLSKILEDRISEFSDDILVHGVVRNESFTRPIMELIAENFQHESIVRVLEINSNPNSNLLFESISRFIQMNVIHKFQLEYFSTAAGAAGSAEIKLIDWNRKDLSFLNNDAITADFDLVVFRSDPETAFQLWSVPENWQKLSASIKSSGFLLHAANRRSIYPFEAELDRLIGGKLRLIIESSLEESEVQRYLSDFHLIASRYDQEIQYSLTLYRKSFRFEPDVDLRIISIDQDDNKYQWIEQIKAQISEPMPDRLWIVSNHPETGLLGMANCLRLEQQEFSRKIRFLLVLDSEAPEDLKMFKLESAVVQELVAKDLVFNVLHFSRQWGSYRFLSLDDQLVKTEHAYVNQMRRGDLSSFEWFQSENYHFQRSKQPERILCHVNYSALNFKDVVLASGKLISGPESALFDCMLGLEFSGRRPDTGQRVMGMVPFKGIATTVITREEFLWKIPDVWSLEDAATVPVVYTTAYYALIVRGRLAPGESVLIHSGAGGVGQAAIHICRNVPGCRIFVTVGTEEKRRFLRENFPDLIPDDHIFSSRDTAFERRIKTLTKGRGVDLVLNSLAGDKLQASVRCLAINGRFLEIGKYDMQMNTALGMFAFLKNITFHGVGLDALFWEQTSGGNCPDDFRMVHRLIEDGIKTGVVQPIHRTVFFKNQIEEAFRYMTTGKHIGKVLVRIRPEISTTMAPLTVEARVRSWFSPEKVYIIAGGLGGVGLELLNWMALRGARYFVVTTRQGIKTAYQRTFLERFQRLGEFYREFSVRIEVSTRDIADGGQCTCLIEEARRCFYKNNDGDNDDVSNEDGSREIGGIFNLTLVLADGMIMNQNAEMFQKVCRSKIQGLRNLDTATRKIRIDHFVAFSSFSCGRGNSGQTNYGYANSAMERIIERRLANGLPGVAIQFGPINDVGVVFDFLQNRSKDESNTGGGGGGGPGTTGTETDLPPLLLHGLSMQKIHSCLEVLDQFLSGNGIYSSYVRYRKNSSKTGVNNEAIRQLCIHLNIDKRSEDECLGEIGLDSMTAVEIQQRLDRDFNISLTLADVRKITVKELKNFRDGNQKNLKQYSDDIKKAKANLSRIRFVIPNNEVVALNAVQDGKPIYCLPPLIGIFDIVSVIAQRIDRPVYGLNWTRQINELSLANGDGGGLDSIVQYYIRLLKRIQLEQSYDLMALDFGAILISLMMSKYRKKIKINTVAIIDLLPLSLDDDQILSNTDDGILEQKLNDDDYKVTLIFDYIRLYIPERICEQSKKEVLELNGERARLDKITDLLRKCCGTSLQGNDMPEILSDMYRRAGMLIEYRYHSLIQQKRKSSGPSGLRRALFHYFLKHHDSDSGSDQDSDPGTASQRKIRKKKSPRLAYIKLTDEQREPIKLCEQRLKSLLQMEKIDDIDNNIVDNDGNSIITIGDRLQLHFIRCERNEELLANLDQNVQNVLNKMFESLVND